MTYKHTEWLNVTYEIKYDYDDLKQLNEQLIQPLAKWLNNSFTLYRKAVVKLS